jgi:glyoxylase-like metal-dependent hydrolase (beta-lactamase superfamily II)
MSTLQPDFTAHPSNAEGSPLVHAFFDTTTFAWTFVVVDPSTQDALIIDSVLEFDPASGHIGNKAAQGLAIFVQEKGYNVVRIMETHVHADHATGALALKQVSQSCMHQLNVQILPGNPPIFIGRKVSQVQQSFGPKYGFANEDFENSFDGYLEDGGTFELGKISVRTCGLPGHTPDSMGTLVGDSLFAGDSIFL